MSSEYKNLKCCRPRILLGLYRISPWMLGYLERLIAGLLADKIAALYNLFEM